MKNIFKLSLLFLILTCNVSLIAATTPPLEKVTLQFHWKHQFEYAGFYAAQEKGFYKEVGLDVRFREFDNNTRPVDYVLEHNNTYCVSYSDVILDYLHGKPIILLANFFKRSPLALVTQERLKLPSDLKGKKIMGMQESVKAAAFIEMFHDFNIRMDEFINVPPTFKIDDFLNKKVDAMVIYTTNELYSLQKSGVKFNLFNPSNYGIRFYDSNLFTSRDEYINHPNRVRAFREASIKGWAYALAHKEEIIDLILKQYNTQHKSKEAYEYEANQVQQMILPSVFPLGSIDVAHIKRIAEEFQSIGLVPKESVLNLDDFVFHSMHIEESALTQQERQYLASKGVIKLCVDPDWMPFESIQNNRHIGIAADIFALLKKESNVDMQLYPTTTWSQSIEAAKSRKCDVFTLASATSSRLQYMDFTRPYITLPIVLATKIDKPYVYNFYSLQTQKIGIVKGYAIGEFLRKNYPNMQIVPVKNLHEGLQKVESGELYGFIDNLMTLAYVMQRDFTGVLKISGRINTDVALAIGTRNDEHILHDIFSKLLSRVSEAQKQKIYNQWVAVVEEKQSIDYILIFKIIGVFLVISIAFSYYYFKLKRYSKQLQKLSITDSLTGLYNRMKIDQMLEYHHNLFHRYKTPCGVILLDIDYFKKVNDTFGHQIGDYVLVEFSKIIQNNLRKTDIAGRWGGEEFLIVCPNTEIDDLEKVAQNLKNKINIHHFKHGVNSLSASFGISCFKEKQTLHQILKNVDDALYISKEDGRNQITKKCE